MSHALRPLRARGLPSPHATRGGAASYKANREQNLWWRIGNRGRSHPCLFFTFGFREPRFTRAQLGGGRGPLQSKSRTKPIVAHWKSGAKPPLVSSPPHMRLGGRLVAVGGERRGPPRNPGWESRSGDFGLCLRVCRSRSGEVGCSDLAPQPSRAGRERWRSHSKPKIQNSELLA